MIIKQKIILLSTLIFSLFSLNAAAFGGEKDERAVREAINNYVDTFYKNDPSLAEKSIWDQLAKRGWARRNVEDSYTGPLFMNFDQAIELSKEYRKDEGIPQDAPREITIFEVSDVTASAKVTAIWGFDYFHLAKMEGSWKIVNVLWQTYPTLKPD